VLADVGLVVLIPVEQVASPDSLGQYIPSYSSVPHATSPGSDRRVAPRGRQRDQMIAATSKRVPKRFADEP
jgi:hypothetical protein